jgi:hypothetical protein
VNSVFENVHFLDLPYGLGHPELIESSLDVLKGNHHTDGPRYHSVTEIVISVDFCDHSLAFSLLFVSGDVTEPVLVIDEFFCQPENYFLVVIAYGYPVVCCKFDHYVVFSLTAQHESEGHCFAFDLLRRNNFFTPYNVVLLGQILMSDNNHLAPAILEVKSPSCEGRLDFLSVS